MIQESSCAQSATEYADNQEQHFYEEIDGVIIEEEKDEEESIMVM
jgi:hypothetical protein